MVFAFIATNLYAAPGDIIFEEHFDNNGDLNADWTASGNGISGVSTQTFNSSPRSLYMSGGGRLVTSKSSRIDANVLAAEITLWIRRGDDSFSEDPDTGEDLVFQYLNSSGTWTDLATYAGNGTPGEIFTPTFTLPADGLFSNLQIRFFMAGGSTNFDYWHVDDVVVTETDGSISGLIGEWHFDELFWNGSNNEVTDSSGNGLHLTAFSAATDNANPAIAGDPGTCSYGIFNGSVSFIQLDDDTSTTDSLLDIPDNLTVTAWINTNVIPSSGLKSILSKDENYEFHINSSGQIYWWWRWATLTTTGPSLTTNVWHHIAITWRSGEQVIYIDGVERARSARTGTLDINNDPLQVGQDLNIASRFFDGEIDEVRIYENFLSAAQVNQVMNETHPCSSSGICTITFEDSFPAVSYNNSTGSQAWSSDWEETDDDNSPNSGNVLITGGALRMDDRPNSGGQPRIEREVNLNGFISAFVTVDMATSGSLNNGDRFEIGVSDDGGATFTTLEAFRNDFNGTYNYDLTAYMTSTTRIGFKVTRGYGNNNDYVDIDNVVVTGQKNCGPDHFGIAHDGSGINCLREAITIQAENADGTVMTDYTGTIDLNLSTNHGNWYIVDSNGNSADPALGTLIDTNGDNDGVASYQFVTGDLGSVVLYLENTQAETTNIGASEGSVTDDNSEGDITFRPFGFVFDPSPIATQIAGRPFDITLTAAGQTPAQAECGVIEEYTGIKSVNFWSTYQSANTSNTLVTVNGTSVSVSEATSSPQNVTFTNGVATVSTQYDDVGQISLSAKDEIDIGEPPSGNLDEIIGGISPFVVRPFGFDIQIATNPYADDGGDPVFTTASNPFNMTLRSVLWQSADDLNNDGIPDPFIDTDADAIPDSGGDLSDNGVTPNISQINATVALTPTALVVANSNGSLSTSSLAASSFIAPGNPNQGTYTFNQSWDEVGILKLDALNTDFMGGGENVTGERINIGRFIPDHFNLSAPVLVDQCGTFTYGGFFDGVNAGLDKSGQSFDISGTITAQNASNATTQNYAGVFAKLNSADIALQAYDATASANASGRVNFTSAAMAFVNGVSSYSDPAADYQFASQIAPFDLRIDLTATDSDTVTSGLVSSNTLEERLGRLRLVDSYGPEIADLEMRFYSDYFDGTLWVFNSDDSCSSYIDSNASFDLTSYTDQLNDGETAIFAPASVQTLSNGVSVLSNGLWYSAPGLNNYGSVKVNYDLSSQPWLGFDWDGDNILDSANGRLNFGYYRGSDRVIYWKEIR